MKIKEINGNLFLIDEDAPKIGNTVVGISSVYKQIGVLFGKTKEGKFIINWEEGTKISGGHYEEAFKISAQQYQEGKTDYIVDTLFEVVEEPKQESFIEYCKNQILYYQSGGYGESELEHTLGYEIGHKMAISKIEVFQEIIEKYQKLNQSTPADEEDVSVSELWNKLDKDKFIQMTSGGNTIWKPFNLFKAGFQAKQGILREKYSEEQVKLAYLAGYDNAKGISKVTSKDYLQSLNKQPEREVEIVMETIVIGHNGIHNEFAETPSHHKKIVDGKEYSCLTVKIK